MTDRGSPGGKPLVVVLGASGFIGSAITAALASRRIRLRAVARRPSVVPPGGLAEVETVTADLTDFGELRRAVDGADAVIHLVMHTDGWRGADGDPASERVNVGVMRELVRFFRLNPRPGPAPIVVFAGSASQVGTPLELPIDGTEPDRPESAYDRQKQAAEALLVQATAEGVVRGISLRLPTVFGHGEAPGAEDRGVLATMARWALAGRPLTLWHDGSVQRDLIYVWDVAAAFVAALDHADALAGRHWLIGSGRSERLGDVFAQIAEIAAVHTGQPPVPVVSVTPPPESTGTDLRNMVIDASAFRTATGWTAQVPLREALDRTVLALAGAVQPQRG